MSDASDQAGQETADLFGSRLPLAVRFHDLLKSHGEERGLVGPREMTKLWDRHIVNSALLTRVLPTSGTLVDVGSGAGLPGVVVAIARPDLCVDLIEPMERRTTWLEEVVTDLGLDNVTVKRGRAEEFHGVFEYELGTARAVAPLSRLARWCLPLVAPGGRFLALKGRRAEEEVSVAVKTLRKFNAESWCVRELPGLDEGEPTRVVEIIKKK